MLRTLLGVAAVAASTLNGFTNLSPVDAETGQVLPACTVVQCERLEKMPHIEEDELMDCLTNLSADCEYEAKFEVGSSWSPDRCTVPGEMDLLQVIKLSGIRIPGLFTKVESQGTLWLGYSTVSSESCDWVGNLKPFKAQPGDYACGDGLAADMVNPLSFIGPLVDTGGFDITGASLKTLLSSPQDGLMLKPADGVAQSCRKRQIDMFEAQGVSAVVSYRGLLARSAAFRQAVEGFAQRSFESYCRTEFCIPLTTQQQVTFRQVEQCLATTPANCEYSGLVQISGAVSTCQTVHLADFAYPLSSVCVVDTRELKPPKVGLVEDIQTLEGYIDIIFTTTTESECRLYGVHTGFDYLPISGCGFQQEDLYSSKLPDNLSEWGVVGNRASGITWEGDFIKRIFLSRTDGLALWYHEGWGSCGAEILSFSAHDVQAYTIWHGEATAIDLKVPEPEADPPMTVLTFSLLTGLASLCVLTVSVTLCTLLNGLCGCHCGCMGIEGRLRLNYAPQIDLMTDADLIDDLTIL